MMDKSEWKVYDCGGEFIRLPEEESEGLRVLTEEEKRDVSYLVDQRFLDFFTNLPSECEGTSTGSLGSWNYPAIMEEFREHVLNAMRALNDYGLLIRKEPVWAQMREKYFNGKPFVQPEEMIEKIDEFDNKEVITFLWFCAVYRERFGDGSYGVYSKEGIIGALLQKLTTLPLKVIV